VILKKENQKKFQIFLFLISTFLIIFLVVSNLRIEKKRNELKREIEKLRAELQFLEEKNKN
jgi:cell division protein FtsB